MTVRDELADIGEWFASRGFGFRCWKDDAGITWADLTRPDFERGRAQVRTRLVAD